MTAERTAEAGIFAGMTAAFAMALFAMVASATYQDRGFFTPMYHIAFTIDPDTLGESLDAAAAGDTFFFRNEPFFFGVAIHMMVGAVFGVLFGFAARVTHLRGRTVVVVGSTYGLAVMMLMSLVVLPVAGDLFEAGKPISEMPETVGWPTFSMMHVVYGLVLGLWVHFRPQDVGIGAPNVEFSDPRAA